MAKDINIIVAAGSDGAIGRKGDLIWHLPGDLKRFKELTTGHPVIMGRKTWDSLPKKPLAGRRNIVLTRKNDFCAEGAEIVYSIDDALRITENESPFIIGGAEIYKLFIPKATRLYLTLVDDSAPDADAFLHLNLKDDWTETGRSKEFKNADGITFRYLSFIKNESCNN